jgi:hypothetical protein
LSISMLHIHRRNQVYPRCKTSQHPHLISFFVLFIYSYIVWPMWYQKMVHDEYKKSAALEPYQSVPGSFSTKKDNAETTSDYRI